MSRSGLARKKTEKNPFQGSRPLPRALGGVSLFKILRLLLEYVLPYASFSVIINKCFVKFEREVFPF